MVVYLILYHHGIAMFTNAVITSMCLTNYKVGIPIYFQAASNLQRILKFTSYFSGLRSMISLKLQGQHIAKDVVLNAINSHMKKSKKPLVMSFHGANGVGKTYVSRMIAQSFFEKGENSRFFHFYYGLQNFPDKKKVSEYQVCIFRLKFD